MELKRENCQQKASRSTRNFWVRCKGMGQKSNVATKIKLKEALLHRRKQAFGVAYLDMMDQGASSDDLLKLLLTSQSEMDSIKKEIATLRERSQYIDQKTKSRLVPPPNQKEWESAKIPSVYVTSDNPAAELKTESNEVASPLEVEPEYVTVDSPFEPSAPPATFDKK